MNIFKRSKIGIKVCRSCRFSEKFRSAFADGRIVDYKIGKWTKRPKDCGPLAVFDNLESAEEFSNLSFLDVNNRAFFSCKYKPSKEITLYKKYKGGKITERFVLPNGTILADKVKILKEVK